MSATKTRIVYIQRGRTAGRIGRVWLSKTGATLRYGELELVSVKGSYKANYMDPVTRELYWVSGPRKDGQDTLYPGVVEIDDVRDEIRSMPDSSRVESFRSLGVHGNHATR